MQFLGSMDQPLHPAFLPSDVTQFNFHIILISLFHYFYPLHCQLFPVAHITFLLGFTTWL